MDILPLSALLVGLSSIPHCLAMCGGLAVAAGQSGRREGRQLGVELAGWQAGRLLTYSLMGGIAGLVGGFFLESLLLETARQVALVLTNLLLIAVGLHLLKQFDGLLLLESLSRPLWERLKRISPVGLMPAQATIRGPGSLGRPPVWRQAASAIQRGLLWGWLPCGLTTSMVITAAVSGSAERGALWMLSFGLGTVPALLAASYASGSLLRATALPRLRQGLGLLLIAFGLWGLGHGLGLIDLPWLHGFCVSPMP